MGHYKALMYTLSSLTLLIHFPLIQPQMMSIKGKYIQFFLSVFTMTNYFHIYLVYKELNYKVYHQKQWSSWEVDSGRNWTTLLQASPNPSKVAILAAWTRDPGSAARSSEVPYSFSWLCVLLGLPMSHGGAFSSCPAARIRKDEYIKILTNASKSGLQKTGKQSTS